MHQKVHLHYGGSMSSGRPFPAQYAVRSIVSHLSFNPGAVNFQNTYGPAELWKLQKIPLIRSLALRFLCFFLFQRHFLPRSPEEIPLTFNFYSLETRCKFQTIKFRRIIHRTINFNINRKIPHCDLRFTYLLARILKCFHQTLNYFYFHQKSKNKPRI